MTTRRNRQKRAAGRGGISTALIIITCMLPLLCAAPALAASISGTVYNDTGGTPLGGIRLEFWQGDGNSNYGTWLGETSTAGDGTYSYDVGSVNPVYVQSSGNTNYATYWYKSGGASSTYIDSQATPLNATGGNLTGINLYLDQGGYITGRITDSEGAGIADAYVNTWDGNTGNDNHVAGTMTDANGYYTVMGVPVSSTGVSVYLNADAAHLGYVGLWYDGAGGSVASQGAVVVPISADSDAGPLDLSLQEAITITGHVYDSSGSPIAGMAVSAFDNQCGYGTTYSTRDLSAADGSYSIIGVPAGTYWVQARPDWNPPHIYVAEYYDGGAGAVDCGDSLEITPTNPGDVAGGVDFYLDTGGSISGTVTRSDGGTGMDQVKVTAYRKVLRDSGSGYSYYYTGYAYTDTNGDYVISGLPAAANYVVQTDASDAGVGMEDRNYVDQYWSSTPPAWVGADAELIVVPAGVEVSNKDFVLSPGATLKGTITDGSDPINNCQVNVSLGACGSSDNTYLAGVRTDVSGDYKIVGLPPTPTQLLLQAQPSYTGLGFLDEFYTSGGGTSDCNAADLVAISASEPWTSIDFELGQSGGISGTVTQAVGGAPVAGVYVQLRLSCSGNIVAMRTTDGSGNYSFSGLDPSAQYYLRVYDPNGNYPITYWHSGGEVFYCTMAESVWPLTGGFRDIDVAVQEAATISGVVTADTAPYTPVEGMRVYWYYPSSSACGAYQAPYTYSGLTASDGTYSVKGVPPEVGVYLAATPESADYRQTWWTNDGGSVACGYGETISGSAGAINIGINFQVQQGGSISGLVTTGGGFQPLSNVYVKVFDEPEGQQLAGVYTDQAGNYIVSGLPPGDYFVYAAPQVQNLDYAEEWYDETGSRDPYLATPVVISSPGQTITAVNLDLEATGRIEGTVIDGGSAPVSGVNVTAAVTGTNQPNSDTDSNGNYSIRVPTGSYYVVANQFHTRPSGWGHQWYSGADLFSGATPVLVTAGATTSSINFTLAAEPNINLQESGADLPSESGETAWGTPVAVGATHPDTKTFTIQNAGWADLTLSGSPRVEVIGPHAAEFSVTSQPASGTIAPAGSQTFTVTFTPAGHGWRWARLLIRNNDHDEGYYNIRLWGFGSVDASQATWNAPTFPRAAMGMVRSSNNDVLFGTAFVQGPSSVDVYSVTLTAPDATVYTLTNGTYFNNSGLRYEYFQPMVPPDGDYTFTVTDAAGRTATKTATFTRNTDMPRIDAISGLTPADNTYVGTTTPTFSVDPVPGGSWYYRFRVYTYNRYDSGGVAVWESTPGASNSVTVPAGALQADTAYMLQALIMSSNSGYPTILASPNHAFYTGTKASPDLSAGVANVFRRLDDVGQPRVGLYVLNPGNAPWDTYVTLTWPDGRVTASGYNTTQSRSQGPCLVVQNGEPGEEVSAGAYNLKVSDKTGANDDVDRTWSQDAVGAVNEASLSPAWNTYVNTTTPTFTWGPLGGGEYARVRIISLANSDYIVWQSGMTTGTSVTVPEGYLQDGHTYYWLLQVWDGDSGSTMQNERQSFARAFTVDTSQAASGVVSMVMIRDVIMGSPSDSDQDGLIDELEAQLGTDPNDPDSDDDGLTDAQEDANLNGQRDPGETNATDPDSDGDGFSDGYEVSAGSDPNDPNDMPSGGANVPVNSLILLD